MNNFTPEDIAEIVKRPGYSVGNSSKNSNSSIPAAVLPEKQNKYRVAAKEERTYNGRLYASKKEMLKAQDLDILVKAGEIDFYLEQVPFKLPGKSSHRIDFVTFKEVGEGVFKVQFLESKGKDLAMGKLKRRQTEEIYKVKIELV